MPPLSMYSPAILLLEEPTIDNMALSILVPFIYCRSHSLLHIADLPTVV